MNQFSFQIYKSPIGELYLLTDETALHAVVFSNEWKNLKKIFAQETLVEKKTPLLQKTKNQLDQYFQKKRKYFDLPLKLSGTEFQNQTWQALRKIPFGKTFTYSEQAKVIGRPKAVRAIGKTNGQNPICIILPCHRVIGKSGKLTGYAGGLKAKKFLLELESAI